MCSSNSDSSNITYLISLGWPGNSLIGSPGTIKINLNFWLPTKVEGGKLSYCQNCTFCYTESGNQLTY